MTRKPHQIPLPEPRKRPSQDRAKFTVQVIYDGFVRIWSRDGPEAVTTRAIAEETGYAVGTLYEYFPNKMALLSGYVRYCITNLADRLEEDRSATEGLPWKTRLRRLVELTAGVAPDSPYHDRDMLLMESRIAADKHHRRAFDELSQQWIKVIRSWPDLPHRPTTGSIRLMFATVWSTRRYNLLVGLGTEDIGDWVGQLVQSFEDLLNQAPITQNSEK